MLMYASCMGSVRFVHQVLECVGLAKGGGSLSSTESMAPQCRKAGKEALQELMESIAEDGVAEKYGVDAAAARDMIKKLFVDEIMFKLSELRGRVHHGWERCWFEEAIRRRCGSSSRRYSIFDQRRAGLLVSLCGFSNVDALLIARSEGRWQRRAALRAVREMEVLAARWSGSARAPAAVTEAPTAERASAGLEARGGAEGTSEGASADVAAEARVHPVIAPRVAQGGDGGGGGESSSSSSSEDDEESDHDEAAGEGASSGAFRRDRPLSLARDERAPSHEARAVVDNSADDPLGLLLKKVFSHLELLDHLLQLLCRYTLLRAAQPADAHKLHLMEKLRRERVVGVAAARMVQGLQRRFVAVGSVPERAQTGILRVEELVQGWGRPEACSMEAFVHYVFTPADNDSDSEGGMENASDWEEEGVEEDDEEEEQGGGDEGMVDDDIGPDEIMGEEGDDDYDDDEEDQGDDYGGDDEEEEEEEEEDVEEEEEEDEDDEEEEEERPKGGRKGVKGKGIKGGGKGKGVKPKRGKSGKGKGGDVKRKGGMKQAEDQPRVCRFGPQEMLQAGVANGTPFPEAKVKPKVLEKRRRRRPSVLDPATPLLEKDVMPARSPDETTSACVQEPQLDMRSRRSFLQELVQYGVHTAGLAADVFGVMCEVHARLMQVRSKFAAQLLRDGSEHLIATLAPGAGQDNEKGHLTVRLAVIACKEVVIGQDGGMVSVGKMHRLLFSKEMTPVRVKGRAASSARAREALQGLGLLTTVWKPPSRVVNGAARGEEDAAPPFWLIELPPSVEEDEQGGGDVTTEATKGGGGGSCLGRRITSSSHGGCRKGAIRGALLGAVPVDF